MTIQKKSLQLFIKILVILQAIVVIVIAILRFAQDYKVMKLNDHIWTFYWIVFSLLLILAEFNVKLVLEYFQFFKGLCGKAVYIIFLGTLLITDTKINKKYIIGLIYVFIGFIYILINLKYGNSIEQKIPDGNKSDNSEMQETDNRGQRNQTHINYDLENRD